MTEDTVEYRLYPFLPSPAEESVDENLTARAVSCTHVATSLLQGRHIWNYEHFNLEVWLPVEAAASSTQAPPHIAGRTCFKDNIEDEWLVVYLLFQLSRHFQDLVISAADGDGEFLLIEAAHELPKWLNPDTAENRVFIHKGALHILPKPRTPAELTDYPVATPSISQAVELIRGDLPTVASPRAQEAIRRRISCFPEGLQTSLHRAHCYLPCSAAHVMSCDPQLVSAAVHILCDGDPMDMHFCKKMEHFSPLKNPSVMTEITFPKFLYAKLLHLQFPVSDSSAHMPADDRAHQLGRKLACSLEILASRAKSNLKEEEGENEFCVSSGEEADITADRRWKDFIRSLEKRDYFRGEIEGSQLHTQLMATAKHYFTSEILHKKKNTCDNMSTLEDAGRKVLHIISSVPYSVEELKRKGSTLLLPPDDDKWLELSPQELDAVLHSRGAKCHAPSAKPPAPAPSTLIDAQQQSSGAAVQPDLQSVAFGMHSFVDKVSALEGAEFPWTVDDSSQVRFDAQSFLSNLQEMIGGRCVGDSEGSATSEGDFESDSDTDEQIGEEEDPSVSSANEMMELMMQMDKELSVTEVGKSFERVCEEEGEGEGEDGKMDPVDVDFNLVKNLLDSYESQEGQAGPASNILHSLGVHLSPQ